MVKVRVRGGKCIMPFNVLTKIEVQECVCMCVCGKCLKDGYKQEGLKEGSNGGREGGRTKKGDARHCNTQ